MQYNDCLFLSRETPKTYRLQFAILVKYIKRYIFEILITTINWEKNLNNFHLSILFKQTGTVRIPKTLIKLYIIIN